MSDIQVDLGPLSAHVDKHAVDAYEQACLAGGFDPRGSSGSDWRNRYRLATFAQVNNLDYFLRVDPAILPGRDQHKKYFAAFEVNDVLMTWQQPRIMLAQLEDPYTGGAARTGAPGHIELIGISLGQLSESLYLEARPGTKNEPNPLNHFFLSQSNTALAARLIPRELATAVLDIAPGWDFGLAGEWFYIQRQPWSSKPADPKRISEHLDRAARLVPYVARLGAYWLATGNRQ